MQALTKLLLTVFGGVIALAMISVVISRRSRAPEAIGALSNGLAGVVAAAVNPNSTNNGNNVYSTPEKGGSGSGAGELASLVNLVSNFGLG